MSAKPWVIQPLRLPIGDKVYEVQPIGYDDGLTLLNVGKDKNSKIKKDSPDQDLFKVVLGDVWDELRTDSQPFPAIFRAGTAALQYQTALVSGMSSEDAVVMGEAVWESGLSPEAVAAAAAAIQQQNQQNEQNKNRGKPSKTSKTSTSTAAASGTRRRASTSGTRSRTSTPRTPPAKKAAASPSAGKRSPRPSSGR